MNSATVLLLFGFLNLSLSLVLWASFMESGALNHLACSAVGLASFFACIVVSLVCEAMRIRDDEEDGDDDGSIFLPNPRSVTQHLDRQGFYDSLIDRG